MHKDPEILVSNGLRMDWNFQKLPCFISLTIYEEMMLVDISVWLEIPFKTFPPIQSM